MSKLTPTAPSGRREFLRDALVLGAGAAVASAAGGAAAAAAVPAAESTQPDAADRGYRVTRHVADYYRTAAF